MSFILDALKKSESERQRKAGPALYEVKLAPPRNKLPWWMIAVGALLGINLIVVIWLLLRSPSPAVAANARGENAAAPAPANTAPVPSAPATAPAPSVPATASPPAVAMMPPAPSPQTSAASPTLNDSTSGAGALTGVPGANSPLAAGAFGSGSGAASDDLTPAVEPERPGADHVRTTTEAGLPAYKDVAATNSRIPPLHLDFHLFAARPQDRFVFINMKKLREGDTTPEGVRVEAINDEGAVLSFEGTRFTLLHE